MSTTIKHKVGGDCEVDGCLKKHYGRGFCKAHHQWHWKRGLVPTEKISLKEKILHFAIPVTESGCWLWTGYTSTAGYGRISVGRQKHEFAHRVAYREFVGDIPDGYEICHKCDTPLCCNPSHLFAGSHWDNMQDSARKGRARGNPPKGCASPNARLTAEQVMAIRVSHEPARKWAVALGLSEETIRRARRGDRYKELA